MVVGRPRVSASFSSVPAHFGSGRGPCDDALMINHDVPLTDYLLRSTAPSPTHTVVMTTASGLLRRLAGGAAAAAVLLAAGAQAGERTHKVRRVL